MPMGTAHTLSKRKSAWTPPTQRTPRQWHSLGTSTETSPTSGSNWNSTAAGGSRKGPWPLPITVMALSNLPQEEHLGFYSSGPSVATAIVRTMEAPREARQKDVKPGATFKIAKDGSTSYWLCRPDGTKVTRIRADAKAYLNMRLEAVGFLPDFQAPECNQVQLPPDQDEGPSYTLALKILGA